MSDKKSNNKKKTTSRSSPREILPSFKTSDLHLSAFLRCAGLKLEGYERKGTKIFFIFRNRGDTEKFINNYLNDSPVKVLTYKTCLKELRHLIYQSRAETEEVSHG